MNLESLFKDHLKWINIAKQFGGSEDEVQDMYLTIHNLDKEVNTAYIWCTLRSICVNKLRLESKYKHIDLNDVKELVSDEFESLEFESFDKILNKIESVKYKTHYSDVIILNNYYKKGLSIRKLAAKFNLAPSTVLRSLQETRQSIREEIQEDYEDYINKEYERI